MSHLQPDEVSARLQAGSVHVSVRGNSLRVYPHVYNHLEDVARFAEALRKAS